MAIELERKFIDGGWHWVAEEEDGLALTAALPFRRVSVSTVLLAEDVVILADDDITLTLPLAAALAGASVYVRNIGPSGTMVQIQKSGADKIDNGVGPYNVAFGTGVHLVSDGVDGWWPLSQF